MKNQSQESALNLKCNESLVIPLDLEDGGIKVFEELAGELVGLKRKAQFFIERRCFTRARLMLELAKEVGKADSALLVTLASLQIFEGDFAAARRNLAHIDRGDVLHPKALLCWAEIKRLE